MDVPLSPEQIVLAAQIRGRQGKGNAAQRLALRELVPNGCRHQREQLFLREASWLHSEPAGTPLSCLRGGLHMSLLEHCGQQIVPVRVGR